MQPENYQKAKHEIKSHGAHDSVFYRNGQPIFMAIKCPDEKSENSNIVILKKIERIDGSDVIRALMAMMFGGK